MRKSTVLVITPLLFVMYGCSSSGDGTTFTPPPPTATSGLFLDAEVEGLSYTTDSGITGQTDENGTYNYLPGEQISFSVGGVNIGTVAGAPQCTPFDFGAASTNIARFIQSLDVDSDPTNGINIVAANTALAGTTISSDAFLADTATFEVNTAIAGALVTTGDTLIAEQEAIDNLNLGTDTTFENAELNDKLFVVIDPVFNDIGIMSFDAAGTVFGVFGEDTTAAGSDGLGFDDNWAVDGSGVLTISDSVSGSATTINRIGGSTRSISVTYSEDGAAPLPATLLIPQAVSATDIGGIGTGDSKTYDVVDSDGTPINITFNSDGTFLINDGSGETGTFVADDVAPDVVTIVSDLFPNEVTFMIVLDGDPSVLNETASILLSSASAIGGTPADPILEFNDIGVGSVTLRSTVP